MARASLLLLIVLMTTTTALLLATSAAAASSEGAQAHAHASAYAHAPPRQPLAPRGQLLPDNKAALRRAKRDARLAKRELRGAEKLAVTSLKACMDSNPGCLSCVPTGVAGLFVCDTAGLGDAACAWPRFAANPRSDGVVNACTCNDGWGSTKGSVKRYVKEREAFIGDADKVCKEPCRAAGGRGGGGGFTRCASAVFNPASCVCV